MLLLLLSRFSHVQLCATPIDSSPPGSSVPGILQARTLEWVAMAFSDCFKYYWFKIPILGLPRWHSVKESTCQSRRHKRHGFNPWEDLVEGENDNPFQYSCLQNPMDRGSWRATVHGVSKESDMTEATKHTRIYRATPEEVINLAASRLDRQEKSLRLWVYQESFLEYHCIAHLRDSMQIEWSEVVQHDGLGLPVCAGLQKPLEHWKRKRKKKMERSEIVWGMYTCAGNSQMNEGRLSTDKGKVPSLNSLRSELLQSSRTRFLWNYFSLQLGPKRRR